MAVIVYSDSGYVRYQSEIPLDQLTPAYLKANYLTGLTFYEDDQNEFSDDYFTDKIAHAIARFEDITHIDVMQRSVTGEEHDYHTTDYLNYAFLQLYRIPATSVSQVRAVYPTGQTIQIFPTEWVRLQPEHSQIHLVPTSGSLAQVMLGGGNGYLPFIFAGLSYLPHLWQVDYISGFDPNKIPRGISDAIMKLACIEILVSMSDLVGPLGQTSSSLSVDGLSQSISRQLPAFKARIDAYSHDLGLEDPDRQSGMLGELRRKYMGIVLGSV